MSEAAPTEARSEVYPNLRERTVISEGAPEKASPTTAVAAWKPEVVVSTRLAAELIRLAAMGLGGNPRHAREVVRDRLYMDPSNPEVPRIFQLEFTNGGNHEPVPRATTRVKIGGDFVDVEVGLLHDIGLDFDVLKLEKESGQYVSNGSFFCALLAPARGDAAEKLWKAVPVGICPATVLDAYNRIQVGRKQPTIAPLKHSLERLGTVRVEFKPTHWNEMEFKNRGRRGARVTKQYHIGYWGGRMVFLHRDSPTPKFKKDGEGNVALEDGALAFLVSVFRVEIHENSYVFTCLGKKGDVVVEDRVPVIDAQDKLDPYRALGQGIQELDPDNIPARGRLVLSTVHLPENGFRQYALELGVITKDDDVTVVRSVAEPLILEAVSQAAQDVAAEWSNLIRWFTTSGLSVADLLGGLEDSDVNRAKVRNRRQDPEGGKDFLAGYVEKVACKPEEGETFNWRSPIQRKLRRHLFDEVVKLAGPVVKPVPTEPEAPAEGAAPEQPGADPIEGGAPAAS